MTSAKALVNDVLLLLEYRADDVTDEAALAVINAICRDVGHVTGEEYTALTSLSQALDMSVQVQDAVLYGVAAQLAQSVEDVDGQARYAAIYSRKRAALPRAALQREDVLPGGEIYGG